jgi:hypothetical protein
MNVAMFLHIDDDDAVACRHALSEDRPEGFPSLTVGNGASSLTLLPTLDRLRRLQAVISAYLAAHDREEMRALCIDCHCEMIRIDDPAGFRCMNCGEWRPLPMPSGPVSDPGKATAETGAAIDEGDLWESIASSF